MLETIKDRNQRVIGTIETDSQGNKTAKDEGGRVLGTYDASQKVTRDWTGWVVAEGDAVVGLVYEAASRS